MMRSYKLILSVLLICVSILLFTFSYSFADEIILFSRYTDTNWQIWMRNLDTNQEYRLTNSAIDKRAPQCGPDEKQIIYRTANSELISFDIETGKENKLLEKFGIIMDQKISKDRKKITFARLRPDLMDDSDVWISDLNGEEATCLTNNIGLQYNPVWSPDASHIAFVSRAEDNALAHNIWIIEREGKNKRQLTQGKYFDLLPDFSPDGKWIVFSSNRAGNYDIWLLNLDNGALKQITQSSGLDTAPVFSPDGNRIVFVASRSNTNQVWAMDNEGANQVQVTFGQAPCQDPCWCKIDESLIDKGIKNVEE